MTSLGAKGKTAQEMEKTLEDTSIDALVQDLYEDLIKELNSVKEVVISTVNGIFINPAVDIKLQFTKQVEMKYGAITKNFDLSVPEGPEKSINDYIAEATKNNIKNVLSKGSITANTAMVLVNTIFFNGTWETGFEKTPKQNFYKQQGKAKETKMLEMMTKNMYLQYKRDKTNQVDVAELPFDGGRFALYIALPHKVDGIASLEKLLSNPVQMIQLFSDIRSKYVRVKIPIFTTETTLDLKQPLIDLGMVEAFGPGADFSGIATSGNICISQVIHKVRFEVTETGKVGAPTSPSSVTPEADFLVDHPFLYFLKDKKSGQFLFQGKYSG
ncbi:serpin B3-like [Physella acuta]|uniref:serpin B3-like n=1 Tax=Physella acuta TaxID=109671 RepID=UPI0027DDF61F|nr:serpin B3-like [Physella acuta]